MKRILATIATLASAGVMAYGVGQSTSPMQEGKKLISTEMTGIASDNGGMGMQVRYTQKLNRILSFDGGLGISGGDRAQRLFIGADYEIYPDYLRQPRFSMKANIERAEEFEETKTIVSIAPTVSKGFNFWGKEAFPYVSIPVGLNLNGDKKSYESTISLNTGINGNIPLKGYRHLKGNLEVQVGVQNSFTAFLAGVSFPMN